MKLLNGLTSIISLVQFIGGGIYGGIVTLDSGGGVGVFGGGGGTYLI